MSGILVPYLEIVIERRTGLSKSGIRQRAAEARRSAVVQRRCLLCASHRTIGEKKGKRVAICIVASRALTVDEGATGNDAGPFTIYRLCRFGRRAILNAVWLARLCCMAP